MRADIRRAGRRRNNRRKNRLTKPTLALGVLGVLLIGLAAWGATGVRGAAPVVVDVTEDRASDRLSIMWAGDTMVGDGAQTYVEEHGHRWVFEKVLDLIAGDVVIVNAEAPITTLDEPFNPNVPYAYRSDPASAQALSDVGVTVLGLANNHALDQGPDGLADTRQFAEEAGLATFGAGMDDRDAERPLIVRSRSATIGVVALGKGYGTSVTAGPGRAGTVPMSTASIVRGYALALAAGADYVVAYVHWGNNYLEVVPDQRREAARFAKAGYDLVVGHGPHVAQKVDVIDSMPVFYSLGNFVFGAPGRFNLDFNEPPGHSLVLHTEFGPNGLESMRVTCLEVDNHQVEYQPQACNAPEARKVLGGLGVPALIDGATATVQLPPT